MDIAKRIAKLESGTCPETTLSRCFLEGKLGWVLGIGKFGMPKNFYYGFSIEEVLTKAEENENYQVQI